jgi:hypothetical protein
LTYKRIHFGSSYPAWTRAEFEAFELPADMPPRPSLGDFHRFNRDLKDSPPELQVNRKCHHRIRVAAWKEKTGGNPKK